MYLLKFSLFIVIFDMATTSPQCGLYGAPPCTFLPAPPGSTPTCAGPGRTYCERLEHYPLHLIKHLIDRWGYDVRSLLADETTDEFNSLRLNPPQFYGPALVYGPPLTQLPPPSPQPQPPLQPSPKQQPQLPQRPPIQTPQIPPTPQQIIPQQNTYSVTDGYKYPSPANGFSYNKAPSHGYSSMAGIYNEAAYADSIYIPRPGDNINNNNNNNNNKNNNKNNNNNNNNNNNKNNNNLYQGAYQGNNAFIAANRFQQNQFQMTAVGGNYQNGGSNFYYEPQQITEYNPSQWLKRYSRDLTNKYKFPTSDAVEIIKTNENNYTNLMGTSERKTLKTLFSNDDLEEDKININNNNKRTKRQSAGRQALCQINTQYIQPQAALNSRGNWMYVVNQPEAAATQLVKTETCASNVCSNLCQVPNGYNSRCEQKYVQKRLIALNANGQNLYTDTFWFPSCCVCTISNQ